MEAFHQLSPNLFYNSFDDTGFKFKSSQPDILHNMTNAEIAPSTILQPLPHPSFIIVQSSH